MQEKTFAGGKAWLVVIIAMFVQVAFAAGLMKAPATMMPIMQQFGVDEVAAGNLMNANGIVALILALPGGIIMQRIGARNVTLIALVIGIVGNVVGLLGGGGSFEVLVASRAIEGFAYGLIVVTTPQFVALWFPAQKRGLPNGITSLWFSIGQLIILNATAGLMSMAGGSWQADWYFVIGFMVIMLILAFIVCKEPPEEHNFLEVVKEDDSQPKPGIAAGLKSPTTWLLLLVFFLFGYVNSAFASYYPTYLQQDFGADLGTANSMTSIATVAMIIGGIVMGFVVNKVKLTARPILLLVVAILVGVCGLVMFNLPSIAFAAPFLFIMGLCFQAFPGTAYSVAPEAAASPATVSITMGVMGIGQNFSGVFGTLITSLFLTGMGSWQAVTIPNAIFMVIGVVAGIALLPLMKKQYKKFGVAE